MSRYTFYLLEQDCTSYAHFFRKDINREFRVFHVSLHHLYSLFNELLV